MDTSSKRNALLAFFLLLLIFITYSNSINNLPTNFDDQSIFTNPFYKGLTLENLSHALSFQKHSTFQPVRDISYMIDFTFWKEGHHLLWGLHIHNMMLYYFMILACWLFLYELFRAFSLQKAYFISYIITLIYAVHPVHVESVTWLFARKETLLGLFVFLCLWAFLKAREQKELKLYAASIIFLLLAALSQPLAIMIPALILLLDLLIQMKQKDPLFFRKRAPYYLLILGFSLWQGLRLVLMMYDAGGIKEYHGGSFWNNLLAVSQVFAIYIRQIAFSLNYAPDYDFRLYLSLKNWQALLSIFINAAVIASAILSARKGKSIYTFFVAWFYILILPVSHILPLPQVAADRYALLPSLSFCVLIGFAVSGLWLNASKNKTFWYTFIKFFCIIIIALFVLIYSLTTIRLNENWKNSQTLWKHTLSQYPESFLANLNLGAFFLDQGKINEAEKLIQKAHVINPLDCTAMYDLALCSMAKKNFDNAIRMFNLSSSCKPYEYPAAMGISEALWEKGDYQTLYKVNKEIIRRKYITQDFMMPFIFYRTGYCALKTGKKEESRQLADKAYDTLIKIGGDRWIVKELANLYTSMGNPEKAAETQVKIRITN
jgi:protein O-mannosyl-transferase